MVGGKSFKNLEKYLPLQNGTRLEKNDMYLGYLHLLDIMYMYLSRLIIFQFYVINGKKLISAVIHLLDILRVIIF